MKIGLVLAGGGAKGAYQVGVLRALDEFGIKPAVIAGTSIGAFNAVLSLSDAEQREAIWTRLAVCHFARMSWLTLVAIALRVIKVVPDLAYIDVSRAHPRLFLTALFVGNGLGLSALVGAWLLGLPATAYLILAGMIAILVVTDLLIWIVARIPNRGLSGLSGLASVVDKQIPWDRLGQTKVDIFVTLAQKAPLKSGGLGWAAEYLRLNSQSKDDAFQYLLSTMALPVIFSKIVIKGVSYVDGGLADNIPIFAMAGLGCDRIYVVHLKPGGVIWRQWLKFRLLDPLELIRWLWHVDFQRRQAGKESCEFLFSVEWRDRWFATEIVHIYPEKRLGWPLLSTVLFSEKWWRKFMALGYDDARFVLRQ